MDAKRKELRNFIVITFAWTWLLNAPRLMAVYGIITLPALLSTILGYLAVFGPGVAAFLLFRNQEGRQGVKKLWKRGWSGNFKKKWLLPAFLLMPVMGGLTILIQGWIGEPVDWKYGLPPAMIVPIGLLIWLLGAIPEEFGWRGYALPRLLENKNPLYASLILGAIWALWHLPLHFIPTTTQYVIPIWEYVLQTIILSIIYTWLFLETGGSILVAGIFHAMGNITGAVFPYWTTETGRWVSFILLLIVAVSIALLGFSKQSPAKD